MYYNIKWCQAKSTELIQLVESEVEAERVGMNKGQLEKLERLRRYTGVGQPVTHKDDKGKSARYKLGEVDDAVSVLIRDYNHVLQKIKLTDKQASASRWGTKYVFRSCYFTLADRTKRITWGQYNPILYPWVFRALIRKAQKKGWLGLSKA